MPNAPTAGLPNPASWAVEGTIAHDGITGLQWERSFSPKDTWQRATARCRDLALGGYDDWRLPSRIELVSLVEPTSVPTVDAKAFADTPPDYFWSASRLPSDRELAYSVYFGGGMTAFGRMDEAGAHGRCVRGGAAPATTQFAVTEADVVDAYTGLRWQAGAGPRLSWNAARLYCGRLSLAGKDDWRLPSSKELQTLIDETAMAPLIDIGAFPAALDALYWSGTAAGGLDEAIATSFADGTSQPANQRDVHHVRCVRP